MHVKVAILSLKQNILSYYKFILYLSTYLDYQPPHIFNSFDNKFIQTVMEIRNFQT